MQRALRLALCTPPSRAVSGGDDEGTKHSLAELGARRASACLLVGHLVESGVPGWEETKAAMIPPPRHLIEAAETPVREEGASGLQCDSRCLGRHLSGALFQTRETLEMGRVESIDYRWDYLYLKN